MNTLVGRYILYVLFFISFYPLDSGVELHATLGTYAGVVLSLTEADIRYVFIGKFGYLDKHVQYNRRYTGATLSDLLNYRISIGIVV